jgi:hypothetical protein
LGVIAAALGVAGGANLAGAEAVKREFEHFGYPEDVRVLVGAIEVGVAATACAGLLVPAAQRVAGVGALCAMAGAFASHTRVGDPLLKRTPAVVVAAAALVVLAGR